VLRGLVSGSSARVGLAFALAAVLSSASAAAFCPSRTCQPDKESCETSGSGQDKCVTSGKPLFRKSSCVSFSIQQDGSLRHGIDAQVFEQVVQDAFDRWLEVDCGGGVHPAISVESFGPVACHEAQYNCTHGNANIFMFDDDSWTATTSGDPYALTTVWFLPSTGEIRDVDVEVNGTQAGLDWAAPRDGVDLPSVLTHEVGHFLGLGHTAGTVMRGGYTRGASDLRVLTDDDIAGICSIYPVNRAVSTNDCAPRNGFASECGPGDGLHCSFAGESGCCSTAPGRPEPLGLLAFSSLAAAAGIARARRKNRASS
jgi:hypothetical protein